MQLRRVRVRNIRSYEAAEVDFPPGTTLLTGDVGAGKTSLLYAIEMALFGVAEVEAAYLVRHGATHAEVEVDFDDPEHRYSIARRFRRVRRKGKPSFEPEAISFRADGATTTYSATELRQRVIELLGFPDNPNPQAHSDLWRWAVYVPQERMRDILAAKAQERLETVRKALGVERYRIAADNAQELAADLHRTVRSRRLLAERLRYHDTDFADWSREADRLHLERAEVGESLNALGAARATRAEALARAEEAVRRTESDRRLRETLDDEQRADVRARGDREGSRAERTADVGRREADAALARPRALELPVIRERLADAERDLEGRRLALDRHATVLRELAEARAQRTGLEAADRDARSVVERATRDLEEARRSRDAARSEGPTREPPAPTPRGLAEIDAALADARDRETRSFAERTRAEGEVRDVDRLLEAGACPTCGQPVRAEEFSEHRREAAERAGSAAAHHRAAVVERDRLEKERAARERYERSRERFVEAERRRGLSDEIAAKAEAKLADARAAVENIEGRLAEVRARTDALAPAEEADRTLRADLAVAAGRLETLRAEERAASRAAHDLATASSAVDALKAELARLDRESAALAERISVRRARIEGLDRGLEGATDAARALEDARGRLARAEEELARATGHSVRLDARIDEAARRRRDAERGRTERGQLLAEAAEVETKAEWVAGPFRKSLLEMEQRLLAHARSAFERNFTRYFASLVDDPALVARTDNAFTPAVDIEGEWTPADALSGGERTSLALAFRLALTRVVRSLGDLHLETILLDEPTDGFSPEQVVRMGELLDELALPQVIVVSHETQLAAIADRVVRVEKRDGRSSVDRPTEVPPQGTPAPPEDEPPVIPTRRSRRNRPPKLP